jgi:hypothetical protein
MASARVFQVALVDRVKPALDYFGPSTKNEVTYTIFDYLIQIARVTPGKFIPGPNWSYRPALLQPHDVVIYFVADRSSSVALKLGLEPPAGVGGGFTFFNGAVTVCEVYVEGSMPAHRLANVAFHELMHNKLAMGNEMHALGGVAGSPTQERSILTAESIKRMSAQLFRAVPQYTGAML